MKNQGTLIECLPAKVSVIMKLIHSAVSKCLCFVSLAGGAHIATNAVDDGER